MVTVLGGGKAPASLTDEQLAKCGVNFCPAEEKAAGNATEATEAGDENENFETDPTRVYVLMAIFLALSLAAPAVVAFFVDKLEK